MPLSFRQELQIAFDRVLWELLPPPHLRKPLTWRAVPSAFAYIIPFYFLAFLARRRDTRLIRLLLLPTIIATTLRGTFNYAWEQPQYAFLNWVRGVIGLTIIALALDLSFTEGRLKVSESQLPSLHEAGPITTDGSGLLPPWFQEAHEVVSSFRGIGWDIGKGVWVPLDPRPKERGAFLRATWVVLLKHFFVVDLLVAIIQLVPGLGSPAGGTLFLSQLPLVPRYLCSTVLTVAAVCAMISGFQALYAVGTLFGVGLLNHPPSAWPPIMQNPWGSHSVSDLWAKRWHQLLRRAFLVYGGIPGGWIGGRPGVILGTFLASGLLHECGIYILGRGFDHRVTFFFSVQGVFVLLEVLWHRFTGYKVQGWGGRIWTYLVVLIAGQSCLDAWLMRGLGASVFVPHWLSPAQSIIIPVVRNVLETQL